MANLITLLRLLLLFVILLIFFFAAPAFQLFNIGLLAFVIGLDGLDGIVARARGEVSIFGSVFDIASDRIIEVLLWMSFAHAGLIAFWVPVVIITRGILVDALRNESIAPGSTPFGMMQSGLGKFLVASRFMRSFFGTVKMFTFAWLFFMQSFPALWPNAWAHHHLALNVISNILVYCSVVICLLRGIPVLVEVFLTQLKRAKS